MDSTEALRTAGPTVSVDEAARALGIGRALAYELAASGELVRGVPVLRLGVPTQRSRARYRVPTRHLLDALGVVPAAA